MNPFNMFDTGRLDTFSLCIQQQIKIDNFKNRMRNMAGNGWTLVDALEDTLRKRYVYCYEISPQIMEWLEKEFGMTLSEDEVDFLRKI